MSDLTEAQLAEFVTSLETLQENLQQQIVSSTEQTQPVTLDQQAVGRVSRIDAIQQQHIAIASQQHAKKLLIQVQAALARIDAGDYGYCQECDELVALPRLKAQPYARLCLQCQAGSEQ
ncbi:MAG: TraR/DksA family transcriptional regulator [Halioglobus sp.]